MTNTLEDIQHLLSRFKTEKAALVEKLTVEFPKLFQPLFYRSELINSIGFICYTPYFNDGDECRYTVSTDYLYINGIHEDDYYNGEENGASFYSWKVKYEKDPEKLEQFLRENPQVNVEESKIVNEFKELLGSIPDEFYADMFDNHRKITIHRDGTITSEYYHHE